MIQSFGVPTNTELWSEDKVVKVAGSNLFRVGDAWHVFLAEDGRARECEVKIVQPNQDEGQILSGLAPEIPWSVSPCRMPRRLLSICEFLHSRKHYIDL